MDTPASHNYYYLQTKDFYSNVMHSKLPPKIIDITQIIICFVFMEVLKLLGYFILLKLFHTLGRKQTNLPFIIYLQM